MNELPEGWTEEDERAWRKEVVREIRSLQDEQGPRFEAGLQARWEALLEQFERGEIDKDQVKREIIRPYLH